MKLICYLSNGYPDLEASKRIAKLYERSGCDIIELDFPSRDPFLESEFIAGRMKKALEKCGDYDCYLAQMASLAKEQPAMKFILMAYENTVEEIGTEKLIDFCKANRFGDMILVGPKDETIKNRLMAAGIRISCYVRLAMYEQEIAYAKQSNGFVYLQAFAPEKDMDPRYPTLKKAIEHLREEGIKAPIYCGVGVHSARDLEYVRDAGADAAFIGKAVLVLHDKPKELEETIRQFKEACI